MLVKPIMNLLLMVNPVNIFMQEIGFLGEEKNQKYQTGWSDKQLVQKQII